MQLADEVEIHGTDIDRDMIMWLTNAVPAGKYTVAPHTPPLSYPDGHFDLVLNHSVFTHLDEAFQDLWLAELRRITAPDGLVLLTVEGTASWDRLADTHRNYPLLRKWQRELNRKGLLHIRDDAFIGSTHPDFYHSTFHTPSYVFSHWSTFFEIVAYFPRGSDTQDLVMLRCQPEPEGSAIKEPHRSRAFSGLRGGLRPGALALAQRALRTARQGHSPRPAAVAREVDMVRAGLYEQGKRISVIAAELQQQVNDLQRGAIDGGTARAHEKPVEDGFDKSQ